MRSLRKPLMLLLAAGLSAGCGTTRTSDTTRTATEQLLVSSAIDQSVSKLDLRLLAAKKVFFDSQFVDGTVDKGYLVSSIRQHLLATGCFLQEDRTKADYVVEVRSGGVGTNAHGLLVGVPQMNLPPVVPGVPSQIPEIPLAKRTSQLGVAKVAVFAYNRHTGERVWQSGVVESRSTATDVWLFGAGPFQRGSIRHGTTLAGESLPSVPFVETASDEDASPRKTGVAVTQAAAWNEQATDPIIQAGGTGKGRIALDAAQGPVFAGEITAVRYYDPLARLREMLKGHRD